MNSVSNILTAGMTNLSFASRLELKKLGPPRPTLNIVQIQNPCKSKGGYKRQFKPSLYRFADWLCGCDIKNAFFCYSCLIMNTDDPEWTSIGVSDIKHIKDKVKKHKVTEKHIQASIEYEMIGKVDIRLQLDSAYSRLQIKKHNENVLKNRNVLSKLIDCIKFSSETELALRGHKKTVTCDNSGVFRELVNLMAELDSTLKQHIEKENNRVFLGLSKALQNELLDSIYAACLNMIREEIFRADFIAIEVDETTNIATLLQLAFVVRYELRGKIHERFITYVIPNDHTAEGITNAIFSELDKLQVNKSPNKLIAQTYNGTSVMSDKYLVVQARVQAVYKQAYFVHCYAQQLNMIVEHSAMQNKQVEIFFSNLEDVSLFFSKSPKRTSVLDEVVKEQIPRKATISWKFKEHCINTVFVYKNEIYDCLQTIIDDDNSDYSTIRKAVGLQCILKQDDFLFWLTFFNKLLPHTNILFNELQHREVDSAKAHKIVSDFKSAIQCIRNSLDYEHHWCIDSDKDAVQGLSQKRVRFEVNKMELAKEICGIILTAIEDRFMFGDHLSVAILLQPGLFSKHNVLFPEEEFKLAVRLYELNSLELKQELTVVYGRNDFAKASSTLALLSYIYDNNLAPLLPESVKLLRIICTIPMTMSEGAMCFSTLKRMKTFTRNMMNKDRLHALAMCSIEKALLSTPDFNQLVIDHFAEQNERRMHFLYKNIN